MKHTMLDLTADALKHEYQGCGHAWAAVKDGKVVALRYMNKYSLTYHDNLPNWVPARSLESTERRSIFRLRSGGL